MPVYLSDLYPLKMRAIEALDRGKTISFEELRRRVVNGEFFELIDEAGNFPNPSTPDADRDEIIDALQSTLLGNLGDEDEHFYVSQNGYCLLLAVLLELERSSLAGFCRPVPNP